MEIDFRTPREAIIYEIGLQTGIIQREKELQAGKVNSTTDESANFISKIQKQIDLIINVIKGI